jgi:hypothetical protein
MVCILFLFRNRLLFPLGMDLGNRKWDNSGPKGNCFNQLIQKGKIKEELTKKVKMMDRKTGEIEMGGKERKGLGRRGSERQTEIALKAKHWGTWEGK